MECANAGHLVRRIGDMLRIDRLLGLEHSIDALCRYDELIFEIEDKGRILAIEDDDIDLVAEGALAVDHMCAGSAIPFGQIALQ